MPPRRASADVMGDPQEDEGVQWAARRTPMPADYTKPPLSPRELEPEYSGGGGMATGWEAGAAADREATGWSEMPIAKVASQRGGC